ncbi:MAG TPA: hypothetical protein VE978_04220 [Chitinophagales bacterium]|nr:hypothetical protein [Chitinophagales bacterium]
MKKPLTGIRAPLQPPSGFEKTADGVVPAATTVRVEKTTDGVLRTGFVFKNNLSVSA